VGAVADLEGRAKNDEVSAENETAQIIAFKDCEFTGEPGVIYAASDGSEAIRFIECEFN
jgi:hypothetical protein